MKKQTARLQSVTTEPEMVISTTYTDGRVVRINMRELASTFQIFAPLVDAAEFSTATVTDFGWTLEWNCGASLDSDRLLELSLEQAGLAENVRFRRWQDANHLSLTDAASAIGLSRRTISQYRTGSRTVPRIVGLACKGWEAERQVQHDAK